MEHSQSEQIFELLRDRIIKLDFFKKTANFDQPGSLFKSEFWETNCNEIEKIKREESKRETEFQNETQFDKSENHVTQNDKNMETFADEHVDRCWKGNF